VDDGRSYRYVLAPVRGPFPLATAERTARSLGAQAKAGLALLAEGIVPPDPLTGMTLHLLASQPQPERLPGTAGRQPIAGGVWVREQVTFHRPVRVGEELVTTGAIARRFARGGRLYSVTTSTTRNACDELVVSSCTTGLVRYRRDPDLADGEAGLAEGDVARPAMDPETAATNPAQAALRALRVGARLVGPTSRVTLECMRARDGERPRNPIHTDPEAARRAGLDVPIAGGNHVLAYLQEMLMQAWHPEALLHGAHFDVRWVSPVRAGTSVEPRAEVCAAEPDRVELAIEVACEGKQAMVGRLAIPLR
jgi:acyl dehydratase